MTATIDVRLLVGARARCVSVTKLNIALVWSQTLE